MIRPPWIACKHSVRHGGAPAAVLISSKAWIAHGVEPDPPDELVPSLSELGDATQGQDSGDSLAFIS